MSWTDPCARCDKHRADCDCKEGYLVCLPKESNQHVTKKGIDLEDIAMDIRHRVIYYKEDVLSFKRWFKKYLEDKT